MNYDTVLTIYAVVVSLIGAGFGWAWFNQKKANALLTAAAAKVNTVVADVKKV